ncbi:AMP-binding protein (plasmid) [Rhodococcus qingshengii]|jgi:fatty-acyl-CoA synthase|uniref:class I adenylate-forming enzyme family protein n=1 Tax=Rhodococcus TaxID=1827 RepID=UPI000F618796|nr:MULTISPECIES: AMP-binding protein [Rhodococcus]AZI65395.1 o-succinylbenzoate--CoA ligase [Rhodococcus sp. NJ-530]BDQ24233.1 AMP-binding protein [Rhodococcus qingshengii]
MATLGGQLSINARRHPDRCALVFGETERTYRELDADINRYAHALLSLGVGKGDRVAVLSPNSDRFLLALYGAFKVGAIAVPLNPRATARELRYLLDDSGACVLLFGGDTDGAVRGLTQLDPEPTARIYSLDEASGFDDFTRLTPNMPNDEPPVEVVEDDDCMIIYTSGTTGAPKGALFDHHRLLWVGHSMSALGLNSFDRQLHVAPMYHCAELVLMVLAGFSMGTTHLVLPAFEPRAVVDALERHRITAFLGVPTMYQLLLTLPDLPDRDLSAWRLGFFGAAPMPPSAVEKLVATLPDVGFFQLCGQTEGGPTGIYSTPDDVKARPDATGRWAITNAEVRLVDHDGNDVAVGETGEMIVRGETIMKGYWNKRDATAETLRGGWLHSGDLAVRDDDGYITIVDRLKDMIITGGRNVYSVEVENALAAHPDVLDVAIVSRLDDTFGETIVAVVTPVEGREVTLHDLRVFAAEYVSDYKLPRDLVVRSIPRNPSGKILKHVLRAEVRTQ